MNVAAIIVTYNRKELLGKCIDAVQKQTIKPSKIFVIDNASTDGTDLYVNSIPDKQNIRYIRLDSNTGGAGGFHYGIKYAHEENLYDAFWVMDDDGLPAEDCLEKMVPYLSQYAYVAPLVISIDNNNETAFTTLQTQNVDEIKDIYPNGIIEGHANPFNGVMFRKDLIEKIGYPMKELFIWGDEHEYQTRIVANGYKFVTVVNAVHYHPKDRLTLYRDWLGRRRIIYTESELKRYCKYRNTTYILKTYYRWYNILLYIFSHAVFYLVNRHGDLNGYKLFLSAVRDGINKNFENHKKYLK